jgi:hypothetical protein
MDFPELDKQLAEIAKASKEGGLKAAEFVQQQAPDLVHQLLAWHFILSLLSFCAGISLLVLVVCLWRANRAKLAKWRNAKYGPDGEYILSCVGAAFGIVAGVIIVSSNLGWIEIWVAPKLYLVEYLAGLLK